MTSPSSTSSPRERAQRLTFEILSQKLDLFGKVLDASDDVLYEPSTRTPEMLVSSVGMDFEAQLRRIYEHARSLDDVTHELRVLRTSLESKRDEFDNEQARTAGLVESRLDDTIRQVFRKYATSCRPSWPGWMPISSAWS